MNRFLDRDGTSRLNRCQGAGRAAGIRRDQHVAGVKGGVTVKLEMFHLMPYRELPADFRETLHSGG
ncbi:MAG: hypothetical protein AB7U18_21190, partial [Dehalococcoidia bacterium]